MCGKKDPTPIAAASDASPAPGGSAAVIITAPVRVDKFDAAEIPVPVGKSQLHVAWSVPDGTAINDDAPFNVRWGSSDGLVASPTDIHGHGKDVAAGFDVPIEVLGGSSGGQLVGDIDLVVCDVKTHSICVPLKRHLELTFAAGKGTSQGRVTLPLPSAKP